MAGRQKQAKFDNEPVAEDLVTGPVRRCVATRARHASNDLIRFVLDPNGTVVPDLACKLPGRGVWVSTTRAAVDAAVNQKRFAAGFKRPVTAPPDLSDQCAELMRSRTIEALALANKAGLAITGFEKVSAALGSGDVTVLVTAADAAPDGAEKLRRKHRAVSASLAGADKAACEGGASRTSTAPEINVLSVEELSLAIGRPNVVHAGVKSGGAADRLIREAERLVRFGPGQDVNTAA